MRMRWAGTIVILLAAAFFAMLGFGHLLQVRQKQDVWEYGAKTEGTLLAHHGRRKSTLKEYTYAYRVAGREYVAERRAIPFSEQGIPVGTRLEVRYDPRDPERSVTPAELAQAESWSDRAFFFIVSGALVAWAGSRIFRRRAQASKSAAT